MASFQAKTGWERLRKKKKLSFRSVPTRPVLENKKKNSKKIQKFKKHHYAFFSSQNGLGEAEKERKKNYCSDQFLPIQELKIQKKQQKNSKN